MLESILTWLSTAASGRIELALVAAAGWGVISIILSPCHLSSIPLVIAYITREGQTGLRRSFLVSLVFAVGILITIGLLGAITAWAGRMMGDVGIWGNIFVAGVFVLVGLYLMDVITLSWAGLVPQTSPGRGWKGAFLLGLIFGIGLGPCSFAYMAPVLGIALSLATAAPFKALSLVAAFGIGHCAVIVGAGTAAGSVQKYLRWTEHSRGAAYLKRTAGALVLLAGAYYLIIAL